MAILWWTLLTVLTVLRPMLGDQTKRLGRVEGRTCWKEKVYSLVQWNWFSDVTGCTWISYIQWRQRTNGVYSSLFRAQASGGHSKARETRDAQFMHEIHSICTDRRDASPAAGLQVYPTSDTCQSVAILVNRHYFTAPGGMHWTWKRSFSDRDGSWGTWFHNSDTCTAAGSRYYETARGSKAYSHLFPFEKLAQKFFLHLSSFSLPRFDASSAHLVYSWLGRCKVRVYELFVFVRRWFIKKIKPFAKKEPFRNCLVAISWQGCVVLKFTSQN